MRIRGLGSLRRQDQTPVRSLENRGVTGLATHCAIFWRSPTEVNAPFHCQQKRQQRCTGSARLGTARVRLCRRIVEVFANDRQAILKQHAYEPDETGVCLFSEGGKLEVKEIKAWRMAAFLGEWGLFPWRFLTCFHSHALARKAKWHCRAGCRDFSDHSLVGNRARRRQPVGRGGGRNGAVMPDVLVSALLFRSTQGLLA